MTKLILSNIKLIPPNMVELTFMTPENIILENTRSDKPKGDGMEKVIMTFASMMEKSTRMLEAYPDTILRMKIDAFLKTGHKIGSEVELTI